MADREKAIAILTKYKDHGFGDKGEAIKVGEIIDLLKDHEGKIQYRTPKKVEHKATLYRSCTCPSCGNVVDNIERFGDRNVRIMHAYCHFCGQMLDWSDEQGTGEDH